ncbi:MFS transporter [Agromyces sp. NPDC058110]|uniref:MFS transporter n=1 Tax=Agromyces sp. NPDC058110 TaxID=3346345 RepID=UPI0036D7D8F7
MRTSADRPASAHRRSAVTYGALVVLAGLNLRDPITSVSATLDAVGAQYDLTSVGTTMLSSLPVLLLAVGAPLAPVLERKLGSERSVLLLATLLALSVALRPVAPAALFLGTVVVGTSISGLSVLMPHLIREHLGRAAGLWSGVFSTSFGVSAAIGAGLTVPLVTQLDSLPLALASWSLLAIALALVASVVAHRAAGARRAASAAPADDSRQPFRATPLLWQVTGFFGCQALVFFAVIAWLPTLYVDRGTSAEHAAALLAWLSIAGLPASLLVSLVAGRLRRQHVLVALVGVGVVIGLAGVAWAPLELAPAFIAVLGFAQGAAFGLGVSLIVLKAQGDVAAFSAFAQGFGYAIAALGPFALGLLHAAEVPWTVAVGILIAVVAAQTAAGWAAGRRVVVAADPPAARLAHVGGRS